jgi:hypothetical protein
MAYTLGTASRRRHEPLSHRPPDRAVADPTPRSLATASPPGWLFLVRHEHDVSVTVLRREGDIQIMVAT